MGLVQRFPALQDFAALTDVETHDLVGQIKTAGKTSTLVLNNPPMATSLAALVAKDQDFVSKVGATAYWAATTAEYVPAEHIVQTEAPSVE